MKPSFLIIGAAKAGTTTLSRSLNRHPDIFVPEPEEVHFFSFDANFARGFEWYESQFSRADGRRVVGDKSNSYTVRKLYPEAPRRIAEYCPDAKLIYVVRHPLEKIESMWVEMRSWSARRASQLEGILVSNGEFVHRSFDMALRNSQDILVDSANYWLELAPYRERFPDERILVLFLEDLQEDPDRELRKCLDFLGVEPAPCDPPRGTHANRSRDKRVPTKALSLARSIPGYATLKQLLPNRLRRLGDPLLNEPARKPEWKPSTRSRIVDLLRADTERFLEFYGRSKSFWSFDA